ncbi:MAG: hypothetical protein O3C60_18450 [Planctomycetota bacterium]|nr:hypothetical protein [Planctomycetota bacterium]
MTSDEKKTKQELYLESIEPFVRQFTVDELPLPNCNSDSGTDWSQVLRDEENMSKSDLDIREKSRNARRSEEVQSYLLAMEFLEKQTLTVPYSYKSLQWWLYRCLQDVNTRMEEVARPVSMSGSGGKHEVVYNYDEVESYDLSQIATICSLVTELLLRDESDRPEFWEILRIDSLWRNLLRESKDMDPEITHYFELGKDKDALDRNASRSAAKKSARLRVGIDADKVAEMRSQNIPWKQIEAFCLRQYGKKVCGVAYLCNFAP